MPFTCPADGIMVAIIIAATSNTLSAVYIADKDNTGDGSQYCCCIQAVSGGAGSSAFPVQKGKTYKIANSSNVGSTSTYRYYPFS